MELKAGDKLGRYEILSRLGKGGMGEVWRAHDSRLNRDVAIKISDRQFSDRFEREARAIAALNHQNICTLHDVGPNYLVMELVEGPTLAERIAQGPVPLEETLTIAKQIADALETAHEKGIVHRDLKPANIKIKPDGQVKVLDFGLAKSAGQTELTSDSPTLLTVAGMILGTAAYMAPEQARGKDVDKRADIWAFGVVLYEMLTGQRLFEGETIPETLAAVLKEEPDLSRAPVKVQGLLRQCLEKDPKKRLRDIGDAWALLAESPAAVPAGASLRWKIAAAIFALVAAGLGIVHFREKLPAEPAIVQFQIEPPENSVIGGFALSPDGRHMSMVVSGSDGTTRLWVQSLDSLEARTLAGTDGAGGSPFWSPDSRTVVYTASGQLMKIDTSGGAPSTLCSLTGVLRGGFWTESGKILFGTDRGIFEINSSGGIASPVTNGNYSYPSLLPDGRHFLYASRQEGVLAGSLADIHAPPKPVVKYRLGGGIRFAPSGERGAGYLLFTQPLALMAQRFDTDRSQLTGEAAPLADHYLVNGEFSVSSNGILADRGVALSRLTWFDRDGKTLDTVGVPALYGDVAISPNGKQLAVRRLDGQDDLWLMDLEQNGATRFTFDPGSDQSPVWSPDGSQIAFRSNRRGPTDLYLKPAGGARDEQILLASRQNKIPSDWSPDGKYLMYFTAGQAGGSDLWLMPLQGEPKPIPYLATRFNEDHGRFSPDGRWVAYVSDESGHSEVYVRPFPIPPDGGGKWMISRGGGYQPLWRRDGKELLYWSPDSKLMSVETNTDKAFIAGSPKALFSARIANGPTASGYHRWDISPDGKRILVNVAVENANGITVVLNWPSLLKK